MTTDTVGFCESLRLRINYDSDELLSDLNPIISYVAEALRTQRPKEVLTNLSRFSITAKYFDIEDDDLTLKKQYLYKQTIPLSLDMWWDSGHLRIRLPFHASLEFHDFHTLLSTIATGKYSTDELIRLCGHEDLIHFWIRNGIIRETRKSPFILFDNGIYRFQHASIFFRSQNTGIIVDPHLHSSHKPLNISRDIMRADVESHVDAILISHYHNDHWHLSTLMTFDRSTVIIVPRVPQASIICDNMEVMLRELGFTNVIAADWFSGPIKIGDFHIYALPFFGEQPLRYEHGASPNIRNWGNTYVIKSNDWSAWLLVDSGEDATGSMLDVAEEVKKSIGGIDYLLSNLNKFPIADPFYINSGLNWLTLSWEQMKRFHFMRKDVITLGVDKVADICKIVEPKVFFPYAHWWGDVGSIPVSSSTGNTETELLQMLQDRFISKKVVSTQIKDWKIGENYSSYK